MATIPLRSPRYETLTTPSGAVSAKLQLTLDSTLRYTIVKSCTAGSDVVFEIAELCRDYLNMAITLVPADYPETNHIDISRAITFYDGADASGSIVQYGGADTNTVTHIGLDGYGTYMDGFNPTIGTRQILFTPNYSTSPDTYELFLPENTAGALQYTDSGGDLKTQDIGASDTSDTIETTTVTFKRIDCTKYGAGTKIVFINKWGAIQELWFFLKSTETTNTKSENYQRNLMDFSTAGTPTYDTKKHPITTFNKQGKNSISLSSGFYPEYANAWFEELLLSENVWMVRPKYNTPTSDEIVPVNVKTSSMTHKTSLNDKLIEYTIEFEEAFDYINNVR